NSPEDRTFLMNIISQLHRATNLISRVKTLSDVKSKTMKRVQTDIHEPILKAINSIKSTFPNREIVISSNINPGDFSVYGGEFLIDVFYNLFHNAVKYDKNEQVVLEIYAKSSPNAASLQVAIDDRGRGIPDAQKNDVLSRFDEGKGKLSGIGLTLAKQIIDRYHGGVWIEDRIMGDSSKGSRIVIELPLFRE
ncbi:MAG: HAMP domain-containing sensor histidine kinase, partial [Candidatus Thorarchaeota archaeon]|nr:HAMP domain-containing sensor histidine kinase [Candidatus Thorarchaeota archaeon]